MIAEQQYVEINPREKPYGLEYNRVLAFLESTLTPPIEF